MFCCRTLKWWKASSSRGGSQDNDAWVSHGDDEGFLYLYYFVYSSVSLLSFTDSEGSNLTPAHHYGDFRFKTYAPIAFRYFREMFGIRPDDYMVFPARVIFRNHPVMSTY